jgi:hypothetical protein
MTLINGKSNRYIACGRLYVLSWEWTGRPWPRSERRHGYCMQFLFLCKYSYNKRRGRRQIWFQWHLFPCPSNSVIFITILDRYDILYGGQKSDAVLVSGLRRRFLDWYVLRFCRTAWKVFVIELRFSIVCSVVQTIMEFERIVWI